MVIDVTTDGTVQHPLQRGGHGRGGAVALLLLSAIGASLAHAAEPTVSPLSRAATALASTAPEPQWVYSASYRQPSFQGTRLESDAHPAWSPSRGSVQLFATPHDYGPGQPIRRSPRLALGFRSEGMRNAMASLGIDAHTCMAPIVRLRGKLADNGGVSGTFWISARCTFR